MSPLPLVCALLLLTPIFSRPSVLSFPESPNAQLSVHPKKEIMVDGVDDLLQMMEDHKVEDTKAEFDFKDFQLRRMRWAQAFR